MARLYKAFVFSTVLIAGAALGAGAGSAATDGPPFRAEFAGSAAIVGPSTTAFTGAGLATRMGRITTDGHAQITGTDNTTCEGGVANTNVETLAAANGDALTVTSTDVACPTGPSRYHGRGHWVVTGGTGRFANASGQGEFDGNSDFGAGTFSVTLTGSVAFGPGA